MIKGTIRQEEIIIVNIDELKVGAFNSIEEKLLDIKEQIDFNNTIIMGNFRIPLTRTERSTEKENQQRTIELIYILEQKI